MSPTNSESKQTSKTNTCITKKQQHPNEQVQKKKKKENQLQIFWERKNKTKHHILGLEILCLDSGWFLIQLKAESMEQCNLFSLKISYKVKLPNIGPRFQKAYSMLQNSKKRNSNLGGGSKFHVLPWSFVCLPFLDR